MYNMCNMYNMYNITNIYKKYTNSWLIFTCWKNLHVLHHTKIWILGKGHENV